MFAYPRRSRSSTRVDSPPPTSMIEAERSGTARSMSARDLSKVTTIPADRVRCFRCVNLLPMCLRIHGNALGESLQLSHIESRKRAAAAKELPIWNVWLKAGKRLLQSRRAWLSDQG